MPEPCIMDRVIWIEVEWPTDWVRSVRNCESNKPNYRMNVLSGDVNRHRLFLRRNSDPDPFEPKINRLRHSVARTTIVTSLNSLRPEVFVLSWKYTNTHTHTHIVRKWSILRRRRRIGMPQNAQRRLLVKFRSSCCTVMSQLGALLLLFAK